MTAKLERKLDPSDWVDRHGDYLFAIAYARVRDSEVAESLLIDTLNDAALLAFEDQESDSERIWLAGLLKNKILESIRTTFGNGKIEADEIDFSPFEYLFNDEYWKEHWTPSLVPNEWRLAPESVAADTGFFELLTNCISELPEHAAAAFTLREMDGLSEPAICEILNILPDDYERLLDRARMHLRRCLDVNWFQNHAAEDH